MSFLALRIVIELCGVIALASGVFGPLLIVACQISDWNRNRPVDNLIRERPLRFLAFLISVLGGLGMLALCLWACG
jgi:hypothetical protein